MTAGRAADIVAVRDASSGRFVPMRDSRPTTPTTVPEDPPEPSARAARLVDAAAPAPVVVLTSVVPFVSISPAGP